MNRRSAVSRLAAASAGFVFATAARSAPQDSTFRSDVVLVLLDVSVKNDQGHFVPGLRKEHFTILEDGRSQDITVFDPEDRPVTVGILLDESRSMIPKKNDVLIAARTLIQESNPLDEVFVLHFNENVSRGLPAGVPFSSQRQPLLTALSRGVPGGKTALYDGVWEGLKQLTLGTRDKKTLVVISDGGDTASHHTRKATMDMVERSPATIYSIGLYDAEDPDHDPGFLRRLAKMSGGETYLPSTASDMMGVCRQIAKEIRTRYTIGYAPRMAAGRKMFRKIEVRASDLANGKLAVRTRSGYRYEDVAR